MVARMGILWMACFPWIDFSSFRDFFNQFIGTKLVMKLSTIRNQGLITNEEPNLKTGRFCFTIMRRAVGRDAFYIRMYCW